MKVARLIRYGAVLTAVSLALASCGGDGDSAGKVPGISDTVVHLGSNGPLSGPASAYGVIANSYPACAGYINDTFGGVTMKDGKTRKIEWEIFDDGYSAERTVQNFRRMNEELDIFAAVGTLGTPPNTAIIEYSDEEEFPNLFVATGATRWGRDFASGKYPWTLGWQPTYTTESKIFAAYLEENHPGSTVAVLLQNDDYGKDYYDSFVAAIEGTSISVIDTATYAVTDPDVSQQMIQLAASGADAFYNITTPKFAIQSIVALGTTVQSWKPIHLLNGVAAATAIVLVPAQAAGGAVEGIISLQYLKDPTDPFWNDDPAMLRYREIMGKYGPAQNLDDTFVAFGWSQCELIRQVLNNIEPTRESLMEVVGNLDAYDIEIDILLPGIEVGTAPGQGFPIRSMQVVEFNGTYFALKGDPITPD